MKSWYNSTENPKFSARIQILLSCSTFKLNGNTLWVFKQFQLPWRKNVYINEWGSLFLLKAHFALRHIHHWCVTEVKYLRFINSFLHSLIFLIKLKHRGICCYYSHCTPWQAHKLTALFPKLKLELKKKKEASKVLRF